MEYKLTFKYYSESLKQHRLCGLKCRSCGNVVAQPRLACGKCGSSQLDVINLRGAGVIQSFTVINVAPEGREKDVPYIVVLVELNEGPWIMGNLTGVAPAAANMELIGRKVVMEGIVVVLDKFTGGEVAGPVFALDSQLT